MEERQIANNKERKLLKDKLKDVGLSLLKSKRVCVVLTSICQFESSCDLTQFEEEIKRQEVESYNQCILKEQMNATQSQLENELDASSERIQDLSAKLVHAKEQLHRMVNLIGSLQVTWL